MKKSYFFHLIIIFVSVSSSYSQSSWIWQNPLPHAYPYFSSSFINQNTGFVSGLNKHLMKTTNRGQSWTEIQSNKTLYKIQFLDENIGFAFCKYDRLYKTTNGGYNWFSILQGGYGTLMYPCFFFVNESLGYLPVSIDGGPPFYWNTSSILKTTNGGINWYYSYRQIGGLNIDIHSISFSDSNKGVAVGLYRYTTINGGANWSITAPEQRQFSVSNINDSTYFSVGQYGSFYKTIDGVNWTYGNTGTSQNLRSSHFLNINTGFAVGDLGTIMKTTNSGESWQNINSGFSNNLSSVEFFDEQNGLILGEGGLYALTTNSGESWQNLQQGATVSFKSVYFTDYNTGFCTGDNIIYKTINSGINWNTVYYDSNASFNNITFVNANTGFISGNNGLLNKTTDSGQNWFPLNVNRPVDFNQIKFLNEMIGFVVGDSLAGISTILKTDDNGDSWRLVTGSLRAGNLESISFLNDSIGLAAGSNGLLRTFDYGNRWVTYSSYLNIRSIQMFSSNTGYLCTEACVSKTTSGGALWTSCNQPPGASSIYFLNETTGYRVKDKLLSVTTDGALTWQSIADDNVFPYTLNNLFFLNKDTGFVVGIYGSIFKTTNAGGLLVSVLPNESITQIGYDIKQSYPNPFNPLTKIEYQIPKATRVSIVIFDIMGRKVIELLNEYQPAGTHEIEWNASGNPSGIYFYKFQTSDFTETNKMILIK